MLQKIYEQCQSQYSIMVAHWLLVIGGHGLNPDEEENVISNLIMLN